MLPQFATQYTAALRYARVTPELEALVKASMENHEYLPRAVLADYLDENPHYAASPDTVSWLRNEEIHNGRYLPIHVELRKGKVVASSYSLKAKLSEHAVARELRRVGLDPENETVPHAFPNLPFGWVSVRDGQGNELVVGHHKQIVEGLRNTEPGEVVPEGLAYQDEGDPHDRWPDEHVVSLDQAEEGTPSDSPYHIAKLHTNGGYRYVAGPHGVHDNLLSDIDVRMMATSPDEALLHAGFHNRDEDSDEDD